MHRRTFTLFPVVGIMTSLVGLSWPNTSGTGCSASQRRLKLAHMTPFPSITKTGLPSTIVMTVSERDALPA